MPGSRSNDSDLRFIMARRKRKLVHDRVWSNRSPRRVPALLHPAPKRIGYALSLAAWIFGAFLLGMGNAYFGVSGEFTGPAGRADSSQQNHHQLHQHRVNDASIRQHHERHAATVGHGVHVQPNQPLPAHCLFCLDGLAATGDTYPTARALYDEALSLHTFAQYTRAFARNHLPRPATRAPPAHSPAH